MAGTNPAMIAECGSTVNVHIHQFQPDGAVVDADALAQFQQQWATYRKLVEVIASPTANLPVSSDKT